MKISTRLRLAVFIPTLMALIIVATLIFSYRSTERIQRSGSSILRIRSSITELNHIIFSYILYHEKRPEQQFTIEHNNLTRLIADTQIQNPDQKRLLDNVRANSVSMKTIFLQLVSSYQEHAGTVGGNILQDEQSRRLAGLLLLKSYEADSNAAILRSLVDDTIGINERNVVGLIVLVIIFAAIPLTTVLMRTRRGITSSLAALTKGVSTIGSGNLDYRIEKKGNDEIADLSQAFNKMVNNLKNVISTKNDLEKEVERRKKAEDQIREVINAAEAGYYEHAIDYSSGLLSKRLAEILGFKLKELPKYPKFATWLTNRIHEEDLEEFKTHVDDFHKGGITRFDHEYRVLAKNGKWLWLHFVSTPLQKNEHGPTYVGGFVFDITERRNMEEALRENEKRLNKAQEIAQLGSWELDLISNKLTWSDETYRIFGLKLQEFEATYEAFLNAIHPDDRKAVDKAYSDSLREGRDCYDITHRVVRKSTGEIRFVHEKCEHIRDKSGKVVRSIGMIQDITDVKRTKKALKQSEERYKTLFNKMTEGFALCEIIRNKQGKPVDFRYLDINPAWEKQTGMPREKALSHTVREVIPGIEEIWIEKFGEVVGTGKAAFLEDHVQGLNKWFEVFAYKYADNQFAAIFTDISDRKQSEEKIIASEIRYRRLFESAKDGILILDAETGMIVDVNPFLIQLLNISYKILLGKKVWELGFFKDIIANQDKFAELQKKRYVRYEDLALETADGRRIDVEFVSNVYQIDHLKVIQCNIRDITERKRIEKALKENEEKLRKFSYAVEQSPASIVITDPEGSIEYVNQGFVDATGYSHKEAIGKNPRILKAEKNNPETYRQLWKTITSGKEWKGELCNKKKNGDLYWEQVSISPVTNAEGKIINFLAVKNNITERKLAGEALRENEEKFRAVAETAKDAIISANAKGEIIYFNKGAEQIFGYSSSEVLNKPITIIMPQRFRQAHQGGFSRFIKGGKPNVIGRTIEMSGEKKDGSEFPLELSLASWQTNNETFITAIIRDITERKNLDQRKDDFITIAGHELRTPVSAVKLMNQVLHDLLADNPQALKYLEKIDQQTTLQANLINDLLDVSKIQIGKLDIRKEQFDLHSLVNEIAVDMQETTKKHKIIVNGKISVRIFADKDRIRQVLVNFCTNAIKFSPYGEKIVIRLNGNKKEVIVGITDYGIGISKENQDRIFEKFYRVYGTGDKTYPGLGMGLYISHQIIKLHNGKIWFESKPGKSTTFYFSLPF